MNILIAQQLHLKKMCVFLLPQNTQQASYIDRQTTNHEYIKMLPLPSLIKLHTLKLNAPTLKLIHKFFFFPYTKRRGNSGNPFPPIKINVHLITLCTHTNTLPIMQMYSRGRKKIKNTSLFPKALLSPIF